MAEAMKRLRTELTEARAIYDGRAKGMLDRASASGDEEGLRTIVARFLMTRYGDDAAVRARRARPGPACSVDVLRSVRRQVAGS